MLRGGRIRFDPESRYPATAATTSDGRTALAPSS